MYYLILYVVAIAGCSLFVLILNLSSSLESWQLLYSMRSVHLFLPWIRRIYIVTADQVPSWLNSSHSRIQLIFHRDLFDHPSAQLPTFNSLAIETVLNKIPGLSPFFLYVNNDFFVTKHTNIGTSKNCAPFFPWTLWMLLFVLCRCLSQK